MKIPSIAALRLRTEFLQLLFPVLPAHSLALHEIQILKLFDVGQKGKWDVQVEKNVKVHSRNHTNEQEKGLHLV